MTCKWCNKKGVFTGAEIEDATKDFETKKMCQGCRDAIKDCMNAR